MARVIGQLITLGVNYGDFDINGSVMNIDGRAIPGMWIRHDIFVIPHEGSYIRLYFRDDGQSKNPVYDMDEKSIVAQWDKGSTFDYKYTNRLTQYLRTEIISGEEELYKIRGSANEAFSSNYQATIMSGVLVAMLGTTVLFYTFRQL